MTGTNHTRQWSLAILSATLAMTGLHHIFRLGAELIVPAVIGTATPLALLLIYDRAGGSRWPAIAYGIYAALTLFWFGFLDGLLDHVLKAVGLENTTFLPGSDVEIVATAYRLWSQDATTIFYEGTGILSAAFALPAAVVTGLFLARELAFRRVAATEAATGKPS